MANMMLSYWYRLYTKQTSCEQKIEPYIAQLGIRYRTQHIMLNCKAILDFYFPDFHLALEIDDPGHLRPDKIKKDKERSALLAQKNISVIRVTNYQVKHQPEKVIDYLVEELTKINPDFNRPIYYSSPSNISRNLPKPQKLQIPGQRRNRSVLNQKV